MRSDGKISEHQSFSLFNSAYSFTWVHSGAKMALASRASTVRWNNTHNVDTTPITRRLQQVRSDEKMSEQQVPGSAFPFTQRKASLNWVFLNWETQPTRYSGGNHRFNTTTNYPAYISSVAPSSCQKTQTWPSRPLKKYLQIFFMRAFGLTNEWLIVRLLENRNLRRTT